jgi:hypothetical protein
MPCTPAASVVIDIVVTQTAPSPAATFSVESVSPSNAPVGVDASSGDLDFHNLNDCVSVTMNFKSQNTFYRQFGGHPVRLLKDGLSFSDYHNGTKLPVLYMHHQFSPLPLRPYNNNQSITFTYRNTNALDFKSLYGIYIADMSGNWVTELDPIVSNGGNSDGGVGPGFRRHVRHHHHHHG